MSEHGISAADVLAEIDAGETVTSSDVQSKYGIPYRTAKKHLDTLVERGDLVARKPNSQLKLYTRNE